MHVLTYTRTVHAQQVAGSYVGRPLVVLRAVTSDVWCSDRRRARVRAAIILKLSFD
jgi:broad specificity phosphatase PhoE